MKKAVFFLILIVVGISLATYFITRIIDSELLKPRYNLRMEYFNGKISDIKYSIKQIPTVKINDKSYDIADNRVYDLGLKIGDSIIKRSNSFGYTIYRKDSSHKWVLIFGNP